MARALNNMATDNFYLAVLFQYFGLKISDHQLKIHLPRRKLHHFRLVMNLCILMSVNIAVFNGSCICVSFVYNL